MAYVINKTNGLQLIVLEDGTVDTSTSVGLVGRNYTGYGEIQNENFLGLLENWANANPPSRPISGQTWFNTFNKTLNVYEGDKWVPVGSTVIQNTSPEGIAGTLWFKGSTKQLFVYNENAWNLVGPEGLEGFGETRSISTFLLDSTGAQRPIILNVVDDKVISMTASSAYLIRANEQTHITNKYNLGYTDSVLRTVSSGVNLNMFPSFGNNFIGALDGNAASASRLETPRFINGIAFDGQNDITTLLKYLNNSRIRVSSRKNIDECVILTGGPILSYKNKEIFFKEYETVSKKVAATRKFGSSALDLAYLASGRCDGVWERNLNYWDIAAGVIIVKEAGGTVTDFKGGDKYIEDKNLLATNSKIDKDLIALLA